MLLSLSLSSELAGSNCLQSLLVALGNVLFKTRAFNTPLVTPTNLNGGKFAATHQSAYLQAQKDAEAEKKRQENREREERNRRRKVRTMAKRMRLEQEAAAYNAEIKGE